MDINIDALYNILKQNQGDVNDALRYKKKAIVVTSDPLALVVEKTKVSKHKEKVEVQSKSEESDDSDISGYFREQTDGEAMINSIQNGDQPLPVIAQVSLAGNAHNAPPTLKDTKFWTAEEKKTRKINRLARSLLIQGIPNDIYSLIDSNETAKDLWNALERQMRSSDDLKKCGYKKDNYELNYKFLNNLQPEWKQYGTLMRQTKNLMDINIDALYSILKQNQGDVNDALGYKKKAIMVTSDPLALVAEKTKVRKCKEKVEVQSESKESDDEDISDLKKITALLAKAFNRKKYYAKLTNNNLRTSSAFSSANKKPEQMRGSEYGGQDKKAAILYEYETFKATEREHLLDTYLRYLQAINDLKSVQNQGDVNDALGYKKKAVVVTSDPLALVAEKMKVSKHKEKVKVQIESEGSDDEDISDLKKITTLLAKAFNRKKYYAKSTNNNLRNSSASSSANQKPEYVKSMEKKEDKKADEKKRDMSKVKCYNCKKE
nr:RNA-directed DNA polymerase, eukaryota [Tanacetum cinerariifolium]